MRCSRVVLLVSLVLVLFARPVMATELDSRTSQLDSFSALSKPVTLTMRASSLKEIIGKIQAVTGQKMWAARDIAADKATIRVKNCPARDLMRELARCFDLGWSEKQGTDGSYLYLWMDKRSLDNMSQRQLEDYLAITKQFDDQMRVTATLVASGTEFKLEDQDTSGMVQDDVDKLWLRGLATQSVDMGASVLQYMKLTEAQRKDLLKAKHIVISGAEISADAMQKWPEAKSFDFWVDPSVGGYLLKCRRQPDDSDTGLLANAVFDDTRYDKAILAANQLLAKEESLKKNLPVQKTEQPVAPTPSAAAPPLATTVIVESTDSIDGAFFGPYTAVPKPGEGTAATPATMSDGLLEVAQALDLPLVAQFVSEYKGYVESDGKLAPAPGSAKTAADRLAELSLLHKFAIEQDGGFLLARSMVWHRLRTREIPEAMIKKWQAETTGLSQPTFGAALEIGSLPWTQLRGAINNMTPWFGAIDVYQLAWCEYGLKMYTSLSAEQRHTLAAGGKVPCSTMTDAQRFIFMQGFERREQPTYDQVKDPRWADTAYFSAQDAAGGYDLCAVSAMRRLGSMNLAVEIERARIVNLTAGTQADRDSQIAAATNRASRKLLAALAVKYPEIKPRNIALYTQRTFSFDFVVGEKSRNCTLSYSSRLQ